MLLNSVQIQYSFLFRFVTIMRLRILTLLNVFFIPRVKHRFSYTNWGFFSMVNYSHWMQIDFSWNIHKPSACPSNTNVSCQLCTTSHATLGRHHLVQQCNVSATSPLTLWYSPMLRWHSATTTSPDTWKLETDPLYSFSLMPQNCGMRFRHAFWLLHSQIHPFLKIVICL